jgi:hypothetical protein
MATELVHRVVLSTKKVVMLRDYKLKHNELAMRAVGNRAKDNQQLQGYLVQNELVKILLAEVDGKKPDAAEREDLDKLFTPTEFRQVLKAIEKITGGDEADVDPTIEVVSSGDK